MPVASRKALEGPDPARTWSRTPVSAPAVGLALLVGLLLILLAQNDLGHLSRHMAAHILLMNAAAPVIAMLLMRHAAVRTSTGIELTAAVVLQIALLWGWHSPSGLIAAHGSVALLLIAHASLLLGALWFWLAVLSQVKAARWRAIAALLITGKLFCLLGALLTFAPRPLFSPPGHAHLHVGWQFAASSDQQLAGLMMLAACPATYVLAGVVIAARWLNELLAEAQ